ncbi:unnamed protein product [Darwinula stevensoni]|uniref:Anti-lipopolysaccharide factor n=1 Tax=Darwinula stevensoni TaxID=69355 RepID=A0A7R8XIA5_9CRUS|nr:unnamed protein product [Darwinula stevensoni]CAG0893658.1 unnamed protein product [Darwinula stevensoni]
MHPRLRGIRPPNLYKRVPGGGRGHASNPSFKPQSDSAARMKLFYFVVALMVVGAATAQWQDLIGPFVSKLSGLWKEGTVDFLGHSCEYSVKPQISKFKLYYKGKVYCPGWSNIVGNSKTKSRTGAMNGAIEDFVKKAIQKGQEEISF